MGKTNVVLRLTISNRQCCSLPHLEELVEPNHLVRIINTMISHLGIESISSQYKESGMSSYHLRMLLKEIYAYICNKYSCCRIQQDALILAVYYLRQ